MLKPILQPWLPLLVLMAAWLAFGIYVRRKTRGTKTPLVGEVSRPEHTITVVRLADSTNILRDYTVLIDGKAVGTVAAGAAEHFPVSEGRHTVSVRIDWCRCPELQVEKRQGENLLLWCGATYNDWRCMFMGFWKPKTYVYVRPSTIGDA